jgi:hypothetical protein
MTYKGLFEKCQTLEELRKSRDYEIAIASPYDDFVRKIMFADIEKAFRTVCKQKGWLESEVTE